MAVGVLGDHGHRMVRDSSTAYRRDAAASVDRPHDLSDLEGLSHEEFVAELGSRIIRVAAHSSALDYRFLVMIAEFDRRKGWELDGHRDCAAWLVNFTGMSRVTARERVRVARKLVGLPRISNEIAHGRPRRAAGAWPPRM